MTKRRKATTPDKEAPTHVELPEARSIELPPRDYQPTKAEKEESVDMPGASEKTMRSAFFRPINVTERKS